MNKMKPTDFARLLSKYLLEYLPEQKGLSQNTIQSYSDSMSLLLEFFETERHIKRDKIEIKDVSCEAAEGFYAWLEVSKGNAASTRNQRRIALNTFFKYVQYQNPGYLLQSQQIRAIPHKADRRQTVRHLPFEAVETILKQPNLNLREGRRDFALLSLMYESAARVSEIASLCIGDLRFEKKGAVVHLLGKGKKSREVPLIADVSSFIHNYLTEEARGRLCQKDDPLFCNRTKAALTRAGVTYILKKYTDMARRNTPELIPERIYPHILRHSRAMHWLEAGLDLQYIKDLLGHADISTTEIYARLSVDMKRALLEKVHPVTPQSPQYPSWTDDKGLMDWLRAFRDQL
jgi:site-specific recombinase XerD